MKKLFYYLLLSSGSLFFLSNSGGYGANSGEGLTGAPGDATQTNGNARTCQFCHNSGTYNASADIAVYDEAGSKVVTSYELGKTYTIRLTVNSGSGTPSGYGFQMIDILKKNSSNFKGFLATQNTGIQLSTLSTGRVYAEQSRRSSTKTFDVKWKAPTTAGNGAITFYAVGNAVNGNGNEGGDNGTSSVSVDLNELTSGVNELAAAVKMNIYPNPTTEGVELMLNSTLSKSVQVRLVDMTGRAVTSEKWNIQVGDNQKRIDVSHFSKGAYMVQIVENQNVISKKIIKL